MKIFIDSADVTEITKAWNTGLVEGVTTNPSLIAKSGKDPLDVYQNLVDLGIPDISMEVMGDLDEMLSQSAKLYARFKDQATIKVPMTPEGLQVCKALSHKGIRTNVTLIFNAAQALLAAKAGATYVSPFVGRIDDQGYAGLEVVRSISSLYCTSGISTAVLAASIRTPHRMVRSFYNGASIATVPPKVFWDSFNHVLTNQGLALFERDSRSNDSYGGSI